jgi:hypothetical protein
MPFVGVVKGQNPFAPGIPVVADLCQLQQLLHEATSPA